MSEPKPIAGWYPDPSGTDRLRYWDGSVWTEHLHDAQVHVTVNRSSVCMADDVDSHIEFWQFPITATVDDLMVAISRQLLPSVAGPAGWCVDLDIDDLARRRGLGLIYTRDDVGQEDTFCRYATGGQRLAQLARGRSSLEVEAVYLTGDAAYPVALHEVTTSDSVTGSRPAVLGTDAHDYSLTDFRAEHKIRREAKAVVSTRRAWIRDQLIQTPPATGEVFVAENLHYLTDLMCPASMRIAGGLLGLDRELSTGTEAVQLAGSPLGATLTMVIAALEWGLERTRQPGDNEFARRYFGFLAECGYRPTPVERILAAGPDPRDLSAEQARVRQLRNAEYDLGQNHGYTLMTHAEYLAALGPVAAELAKLGEIPNRPGCAVRALLPHPPADRWSAPCAVRSAWAEPRASAAIARLVRS